MAGLQARPRRTQTRHIRPVEALPCDLGAVSAAVAHSNPPTACGHQHLQFLFGNNFHCWCRHRGAARKWEGGQGGKELRVAAGQASCPWCWLWTGQGWRGCRSSEGCPAPGGHQLSPRHFCLMSPSPPQTPPRQGCHNLPGDPFWCFPVCRVRKVSLCLTQTSFVQLNPKSSCPLRTGEWGGCTRRGCNPARLLCLFQIKRRGVWFLRQTPSNQ